MNRWALATLLVAAFAFPSLSQTKRSASKVNKKTLQRPAQVREYGFNIGRDVYVREFADRTKTPVEIKGYAGCIAEFWGLNRVAEITCAQPTLHLLGDAIPICPDCEDKYTVEWHKPGYGATELQMRYELLTVVASRAQIRDEQGIRFLLYPEAARAMTAAGARLENAALVLANGQRVDLRRLYHRISLAMLHDSGGLGVYRIEEFPTLLFTVDLTTGRVEKTPDFERVIQP